ncbi:MAG: hypothetical protein NVSMB13_03830 [Mycobacteriales bacterium]
MSSPAAPGRRTPPGRYGRPPSRRRQVIGYAAYAVVGVLLVLGLLLFYAARGRMSLHGQLRSFERTSDSAIRITCSVTKAASEDARCTIRARGLDGSQVGAQEVEVLPDVRAGRETVLTVELATTAPAVSGELVGCRLIPSR